MPYLRCFFTHLFNKFLSHQLIYIDMSATKIMNRTNSLEAKINVILLPLEGDPQASSNFWKLTAKNNGLLFVPSKDWP